MRSRGVRLRFRPTTTLDWARFLGGGWRLLNEAVRELSRADLPADAAARAARQTDWCRRLLGHLDVRMEVCGREHLADGPYVIVCLHESVVDPLFLLALGAGPMRMVAREELFDWPGIGDVLRRHLHIAIDPESGAREWRGLLRVAREVIESGEHLVMFPQGNVLGIETAFRPGAFRLAERCGVPLLPIALSGPHRVWEHPFNARLRYGQSVRLTVLPPVSPGALGETKRGWRGVERQLKALALEAPSDASPRRFVPARDGWWDGYAWQIDPDFVELHAAAAARRGELRCDRVRAPAPSQDGSNPGSVRAPTNGGTPEAASSGISSLR